MTQDQDLGEALLQGAVNIAASTAGGLGANTIGDWRAEGSIDALTHKALHGLLGAVVGAASNLEDPGKGAAGGAIGAVCAEVVAENLPGSMEPQTRANIGLAAGTTFAVLAGQDGNAALLAATNAVENNLKMHMDCLLGGGKDVEGIVKDAEKFIDITIENIESFGEEGRALGGSLADVLKVGGPLKEGLEIGGKNIGLGVGLGLNGIDLLRGKGKGNARARPSPKAQKQAPSISPITPGSTSTLKPSVASSSVAVPVKATPVPAPNPTSSMKKPATSYGKTSVTKPTGSTNLSALDLVAPKKAAAPKASVELTAAPFVRSPAASSVKLTPAAKASSTSVQKPASSMQRASTSYERTSSHPASSSSSRSPQAPSTAPPSSSSSQSSFYNPHKAREALEIKYPGKVSSSTVPQPDAKNVKLAGQRHPVSGIVFDHRGLPIFDDVAKFDTKIARGFSALKNERLHMRTATKILRAEINAGKIDRNQFTKHQLEDIMAGKDRISELTWHHHQDIGRMQLISRETHIQTGHVGGMEMWFHE